MPEQTQLQGLKNFSVNIAGTMEKIKTAYNNGKGVPAKLDYHEQCNILQYYLEVINYLSKQ